MYGCKYDMFIINAERKVVSWVRQGERRVAAVQYDGRRYYVHRLAAYGLTKIVFSSTQWPHYERQCV